MFDKLLHRDKPQPPPTEDLSKKLQIQINDLEKQSASLHSEIMATKRPSTRAKLQAERSPILEEIRILTTQKDAQKDIQASIEIDKLFHKTLAESTMILSINGHRTKIPKDLIISLKFKPCKHTKQFHVKELESYRRHIPSTNVQTYLLAKWQGIHSSKSTITYSYNCDQCREAKAKRLRIQHTHTDADIIGKCHVSLSIL